MQHGCADLVSTASRSSPRRHAILCVALKKLRCERFGALHAKLHSKSYVTLNMNSVCCASAEATLKAKRVECQRIGGTLGPWPLRGLRPSHAHFHRKCEKTSCRAQRGLSVLIARGRFVSREAASNRARQKNDRVALSIYDRGISLPATPEHVVARRAGSNTKP